MIHAEKRTPTPIEDEVFTNEGKITFGKFLDNAPTEFLLKVLNSIENELLVRYKNTANFLNHQDIDAHYI